MLMIQLQDDVYCILLILLFLSKVFGLALSKFTVCRICPVWMFSCSGGTVVSRKGFDILVLWVRLACDSANGACKHCPSCECDAWKPCTAAALCLPTAQPCLAKACSPSWQCAKTNFSFLLLFCLMKCLNYTNRSVNRLQLTGLHLVVEFKNNTLLQKSLLFRDARN